ncbi:MAG TPA: GGDEF domain-containing protein [Pilimelia sp.]|nr:GGDEF domain-containing protein [Pilimelia sp.]
MTTRTRAGDLIPVEDRLRWMLVCRAGLAVAVLGSWYAAVEPRGSVLSWLVTPTAWLAGTALSVFAVRGGRRFARFALTVTLLGDGVLLGAAWWALGALQGSAGYLVVLHAVAVTLLASFRTGVKLAVWHSVIAVLFLEATAAGMLGAAAPVPATALSVYLAALWTSVLGTASFAAMNERELRRRRYDSEVLREFALRVAAAQDPASVAVALAAFARDELLCARCVVVGYLRDSANEELDRGLAVVIDGERAPTIHRLSGGPPARSLVRVAADEQVTLLRSRLGGADGWLAEALPEARDLVVIPFVLDQVVGALVLEAAGGRSRRIERRLVGTAEQATTHASIALERAVLTDRLRAASQTDGLTRVANRRRLDEVLVAELNRARSGGRELAVLMIDLDHFKKLNDTFGHLVGDEVLRQVAGVIRESCPEPSLVARYGGEEFVVVLSGVDITAALTTAERIRMGIVGAPTATPATASIGVAVHPAHGDDAATLLAAADAALYQAKAGGRNRVVAARSAAALPGERVAASDVPVH